MNITTRALAAGLLLSTSTMAVAQQAPIVLPGAPGEAPRVIDEDEALALSDTRFSPARLHSSSAIGLWSNRPQSKRALRGPR